MPLHKDSHPLRGYTVKIAKGQFRGSQVFVEDWMDLLLGDNPWDHPGNPSVLAYTVRAATDMLPMDQDVIGCKLGGFSTIFHVTELGDVVQEGYISEDSDPIEEGEEQQEENEDDN